MPFRDVPCYLFPFLTVPSNLLFSFLPHSSKVQVHLALFSLFQVIHFSLFRATSSPPSPFQPTLPLSHLFFSKPPLPLPQHFSELFPFLNIPSSLTPSHAISANSSPSHCSELPFPLPDHFSQLFPFFTIPSYLFPSLTISHCSEPLLFPPSPFQGISFHFSSYPSSPS